MSNVKNEHYVPQSYLNHFGNGTNKKKKIYQINVYDKNEKKSYKANVDKVAAEGKYFHMPEELVNEDFKNVIHSINKEQLIEKSFGEIEGPFKRCLDKIRSSHKMLVNPEGNLAITKGLKRNLSYFLAIQLFRSKAYRSSAEETETKFNQLMIDVIAKENDPNYQEGDVKYVPHEDSAKLLQTSFLFDPIAISKFADVLNNHAWLVFVNHTNNKFITSDNPIVRRANINDKLMSYGGIASKGIEIAFPVSPNLLLMMYERSYHVNVKKYGLENKFWNIKDNDLIDHYNTYQIIDSERQIFSKDDTFINLVKRIKKESPGLLDNKSTIEIHFNGKVY